MNRFPPSTKMPEWQLTNGYQFFLQKEEYYFIIEDLFCDAKK